MTSDVVVKKRMRQVLVLVMALVVVGLAVLYGANRLHVPDPVLDEVEMDNQTLAALGGMEQTAIRNGIKEWHLKARRGTDSENTKPGRAGGGHGSFFSHQRG